MRFIPSSRRGFAVASAACIAAVGAGIAGAGTAHAATPPPLHVTLSACGTGSSAVWGTSGTIVGLTVGNAAAETCGAPTGSTYNPAYAQVGLKVAGQPAPASSPAFTTDNYASGSPRMVVDLNNGKSLVGYPAKSGLNGTDMAWAVGNSGTYTDYETAYTTANANVTTVKDAFIVEDADQPSGATDTISDIQFGGATVQVANSNPVVVKNRHSGKCLNENRTNAQISQYGPCSQASIYNSLVWKLETFADGSKYLVSQQTGDFVSSDGVQGDQLLLSSTPSPVALGNGGFFRFGNLYMDVKAKSTANFAQVIGWTYNGQDNQRWDFANAPS